MNDRKYKYTILLSRLLGFFFINFILVMFYIWVEGVGEEAKNFVINYSMVGLVLMFLIAFLADTFLDKDDEYEYIYDKDIRAMRRMKKINKGNQ